MKSCEIKEGILNRSGWKKCLKLAMLIQKELHVSPISLLNMLFVDLKEPERILLHMSPISFAILDLKHL